MTAPNTAPSPGTVAAPVDPTLLNDGEGDGFDALTTPVADAPSQPGSIADASRALRDAKDEAPVAETTEQPRNPDGTFAPKEPKAETEATDAPADAPESPTTDDQAEPEGEPAEPKVFVLKGEEQRGESDIELDITGLPPEAIERLERLEKQGMRRATFDAEMRKVRADRANLDAVETEIAVDTEGFLLNRVAPAKRRAVAEALLVEQFDELAPMIEELWNNPQARYSKLEAIRNTIASRRGEVATATAATTAANEIREAVYALIPDTANEADINEFFATSITLLQQRAMRDEALTSKDVPKLLDAHRRRFFGASDAAPTKAPSRPKLAVKTTPSAKAAVAAPSAPSTVVAADEIARRAQARQRALATAPKGAGVGAVQRDVGPANETIEQRSRRLRAGQ